MTFKERLIHSLQKNIIANPPESELSVDTEEDSFRAFFIDWRPNGTLQLTEYGLHILKLSGFDFWECELVTELSTADQLYLMRASPYPYFINGTHFTTFDQDLGMVMCLVSGDLKKIRDTYVSKKKIVDRLK